MEKTGLQRNWVRSLLTVLTTAVMALIFCFSMEPAEQSDKTSGILARQMIRALYPEYDHYPETQQTELYDSIQAVVRKTAHFMEFAVLGVLLRLCLESWFGKQRWLGPANAACRVGSLSDPERDRPEGGGKSMSMNIVLVHPEIPQNTGNIARTCAATGTVLHLIEPLGFSLDDRYLKRAGLDYWHLMEYHVYRDEEEFIQKHPGIRAFFATTKAPRGYHEAEYRDGDYLVFGCETRGLPENLLQKVYDHCIRIPMREEARSLNLANSVAIVLYEALRQNRFPGMSAEGNLTGREESDNPWLDYI